MTAAIDTIKVELAAAGADVVSVPIIGVPSGATSRTTPVAPGMKPCWSR